MTLQRFFFHPARARDVLLAMACSLTAVVAVSRPAHAAVDKGGARSTLAITYAENSSTTIDLRGSLLRPGVLGKADVKRKDGRTRLSVHLDKLPHPQDIGSFYTTYVLWAVAPEGQAANLAELPHSKNIDIEVTTAFQTFGLVVTAEPHGGVSLPSPISLAEGSARDDTRGRLQAGMLEYSSATGTRYVPGGPRDLESRDYVTPLILLGAHRAVEIARDSGAATYAENDLKQAEAKLASLDRVWPRNGRFPTNLEGEARDVMRLAEHARIASLEGADRARIAAERRWDPLESTCRHASLSIL